MPGWLWLRWFRAALQRTLPSSGRRHRSAQAAVGTQYVSMSNDGAGNVRLTFIAGAATSTVVLEGAMFESATVANNGRYGSLTELFGRNETRLLYLSADPFSAGLLTAALSRRRVAPKTPARPASNSESVAGSGTGTAKPRISPPGYSVL